MNKLTKEINQLDWQQANGIDSVSFSVEEARQERLAKGVKVVVMGPPHSGKSVFIESLMNHFDADLNATMLSGCPDGEGLWLQKHYDNPDVARLRRKGSFTPEFVAFASESVRNFENPLAVVDIGGRVSDENRIIAAGATHAIILAGDLGRVAEWQDFANELGLPVVAKIHSHYTSNTDTILRSDSDGVVGSTHYLERGTSDEERESVAHVAQLLTSIANRNAPYWQARSERKMQDDEVTIVPREVARGLGRAEKTKVLPNGSEVEVVEFEPEDVQALYTLMEGVVTDKVIKIDGFVKGWEFTAMAFAALSNNAEAVEQNSPNGFVRISSLSVGEVKPEQGVAYEIMKQDNDEQFIDVVLDGPVQPEILEELVIPEVDGETVVLSGKIPHWLRASIAITYAKAGKNIDIFTPGEATVRVWRALGSNNKEELEMINNRIATARAMAYAAHEGQVRRGSEVPYITHPEAVAEILAAADASDDVICAGLLHDVIEDSDIYTASDIKEQLGSVVVDTVLSVSEKKQNNGEPISWKERKLAYMKHLEGASQESLQVSAADKIHNMQDIMADYVTIGEELWGRFNAPKSEQLWFYQTVTELIEARMDNKKLTQMLRGTFDEMKQRCFEEGSK